MRPRRFAPFALAALTLGIAFAQDAPDNRPIDPGEDPPGRAARLSLLTGTVSFQPGGVEDWIPATANRPLTTGDRLWTETGSRAELQTGEATLRLNARTNFTFLNLDDATTQIQLSAGTLAVRLRRLDQNEVFEIDTPHSAFTLLAAGDYRVDVNEQGDATLLTVRAGQAEAVTTDNRVVPLGPRTQARILMTVDSPPIIDTRDAPVADSFDNFCMDRDRREDRSESARHLSREVPGYADLDDRGVWREDQQYGWIWAPRVDPGWAPYQTGHWAWISPWGWTWVDDEPWGYAPFHYGRWVNAGGWVWIPGPPAVRPVYSPALVAWVGGPRFSASLSIGGGAAAVGWFPLGPGEVWVPSYRASPRYFERVNVSNTVVRNNVNITNVYNTVYVNKTVNNTVYVNQRVNGAVTAVPQNAMGSGRPVAQASIRVPRNAVENAQVQQTSAVAPQRAALFGGRQGGSAAPPAAFNNRTVAARAVPPAAVVPFERQQQALQANPGQPLTRNSARFLQPGSPAASPQRAQIRQLNAPPPNPAAPAAPQPANARQGFDRPGRTAPVDRTPNGPPINRSTETVAPRVAPPAREAAPVTRTVPADRTAREAPVNRSNENAVPRVVPPVRNSDPLPTRENRERPATRVVPAEPPANRAADAAPARPPVNRANQEKQRQEKKPQEEKKENK